MTNKTFEQKVKDFTMFIRTQSKLEFYNYTIATPPELAVKWLELELDKQKKAQYDKNSKVRNIKLCPYCGELREAVKGVKYYCSKADKNFSSKDLLTVGQYLVRELREVKEEIHEAIDYQLPETNIEQINEIINKKTGNEQTK